MSGPTVSPKVISVAGSSSPQAERPIDKAFDQAIASKALTLQGPNQLTLGKNVIVAPDSKTGALTARVGKGPAFALTTDQVLKLLEPSGPLMAKSGQFNDEGKAATAFVNRGIAQLDEAHRKTMQVIQNMR